MGSQIFDYWYIHSILPSLSRLIHSDDDLGLIHRDSSLNIMSTGIWWMKPNRQTIHLLHLTAYIYGVYLVLFGEKCQS